MKLIVIEGLDGSGKQTQTKLLQQKLLEAGVSVRTVSFPDYEKPWSVLVRMYLDGAFGKKPQDVSAYAASVFFAVDRFASFRSEWQDDYENGRLILCDRYVESNAIYQVAKLPKDEWDAYLQWLFDLEYQKLLLPKPDKTIYLKMHPQTSANLLKNRYQGDREKFDIHEKDMQYLLSCHESADYVGKKCGWDVIECCDGQTPLAREVVAEKIWQSVSKEFF